MLYEEHFILSVIPPFRLDLTVWALRRRQKNIIDLWDGQYYRRVFALGSGAVCIVVKQTSEIELDILVKSIGQKHLQEAVTKKLQEMLGTEKNLNEFYKLTEKNAYLRVLGNRFRGVKPPRFASIYEALINAVACQQVTLDLGIALLNKLAEKYGRKFEDMSTTQYAFPEANDLSVASVGDLRELGFSYQKAKTIIEISKLLIEGKVSFENMESLPNEEVVEYLTKMKGIGRWSAEYVLLRGFGRIDIFPGDDVGAQNNLKRIFTLAAKPDYEEIKKLTAEWHPYAGLVYFHLLLDKLRQKQVV